MLEKKNSEMHANFIFPFTLCFLVTIIFGNVNASTGFSINKDLYFHNLFLLCYQQGNNSDYNKPLCMACIDYERHLIQQIPLQQQGALREETSIGLLKDVLKKCASTTTLRRMSGKIPLRTGIRQEDPFSLKNNLRHACSGHLGSLITRSQG